VKLSLMLFSGELAADAQEQYDWAIRIARFADTAGFEAIWFPERHFTKFGAPYPNPLLLLAAAATVTDRIGLRAGSLVLPLHDPLRVAEDLSMLDNLSGGRVEAAFASGWHPNDFAFRPDAYERRRAITVEAVGTLERLWAGRDHAVVNGCGDPFEVRLSPSPFSPRLRCWLTAAQTPETFRAAGTGGHDLLTHVLDGNFDVLHDNIGLYRRCREEAGLDPSGGRVALMLHTFVGENMDEVIEVVRAPYTDYLRSIAPLAGGLASARARSISLDRLEPRHLDQFVNFHFERAIRGRSLIGTPASLESTVRKVEELGVDEIACLIDFGLPGRTVFDHLPSLAALRERIGPDAEAGKKLRMEI
jgi:natural product biosynthesis luciferase-like monooxygenase protein